MEFCLNLYYLLIIPLYFLLNICYFSYFLRSRNHVPQVYSPCFLWIQSSASSRYSSVVSIHKVTEGSRRQNGPPLKSLLQHHNSQVAKKLPANAGGMRCRFDLWVGKIPWSRAWQLTPIFLPGELRGQRSLAGYSPWGHKDLDTTEQVSLSIVLLSLWK